MKEQEIYQMSLARARRQKVTLGFIRVSDILEYRTQDIKAAIALKIEAYDCNGKCVYDPKEKESTRIL